MVAQVLPYADAGCADGVPVAVSEYGSRIFVPPVVGFWKSLKQFNRSTLAAGVVLFFVAADVISRGGMWSPAQVPALLIPVLWVACVLIDSLAARRASTIFEITADTFAVTQVSALGGVRIRRWDRRNLQYSVQSHWGRSCVSIRQDSGRGELVRISLDKAGVDQLRQLLLEAFARQYELGDPPAAAFSFLSARERLRWLRRGIIAVAVPLLALSFLVALVSNCQGDPSLLAWTALGLGVLMLRIDW